MDAPISMETITLLVASNRNLLHQAAALVTRITDPDYHDSPEGWAPHRVGGHLRHILEFYGCFLEGLPHGVINYDARRRDPALETSRIAALSAIHDIDAALGSITGDRTLLVYMEDAPMPDSLLESTVARELQSLASHTIHHFALLGITLRLRGVRTPPDFGVAPSTLRHREQSRSAAA
jgi:hypothetical protein